MKITLDLNFPGLEPGGTSEPKKSRKRRKRFRRAMKDLPVREARFMVPILEGLLAANASQLHEDDLEATGTDWIAIDARQRYAREHAERAEVLGTCLASLLEDLERQP